MEHPDPLFPLIEADSGAAGPSVVKLFEVRQQNVEGSSAGLLLVPQDFGVFGGEELSAAGEAFGDEVAFLERVEHVVDGRVFVAGRLRQLDRGGGTELEQCEVDVGLSSGEAECGKLVEAVHDDTSRVEMS